MELRKVPDRMIITVQDLVNITGKNVRACQRILRKIRQANGKTRTGMVSAKELCTFCSLDLEEVSKYLKY
jgi:hypothetical protein